MKRMPLSAKMITDRDLLNTLTALTKVVLCQETMKRLGEYPLSVSLMSLNRERSKSMTGSDILGIGRQQLEKKENSGSKMLVWPNPPGSLLSFCILFHKPSPNIFFCDFGYFFRINHICGIYLYLSSEAILCLYVDYVARIS